MARDRRTSLNGKKNVLKTQLMMRAANHFWKMRSEKCERYSNQSSISFKIFFDPQESAPVMLQLSHVLPIHYLLGTSIPPTHPVGGERGTLQPHTTYLP